MKLLFNLIILLSAIIFCSFCNDSKEELRLSKSITKRKTIPNKYRKDSSILYLKLRPPIEQKTKWGNGVCMNTYEKGKLEKLPEWIINFKKLKAIDLIGNNSFQITNEINKIKQLPKLEYLAFSISRIDGKLINALSELTMLNELHIMTSVNKEEKNLLDKLKLKLPKCKVVASLYADYGDVYFQNKNKNL